MNDYYPLIAKAVSKLERNTLEARQALYEHARKVVEKELGRHVLESELALELRALEAAIQWIEAQSVPAAGIEAQSVPAAGIEVESVRITTIESESLKITPIETDVLPIPPGGETRSVSPVATNTAEQHRRRAVMFRAIGTPRCLELAKRCEQLADAIEAGK
jgi:hypothetical protein